MRDADICAQAFQDFLRNFDQELLCRPCIQDTLATVDPAKCFPQDVRKLRESWLDQKALL